MFLKSPMIAIDIGTYGVKFVEISKNRTLKAIGTELLPEGVIVDGMIQDNEIVEKSLKKLIKKLKIRTFGKRAAVSLGGSSVIIKKVNYPNKDDLELADMIEAEAEQHFQHDINELYFTWHTFRSNPGIIERPVILVAAKRDLVEQYISVVKSVGIKIGLVDCDVFSIFNAFEANFGIVEGLIAIANIGASSTQVILIGNGHYLYTRDIPIGGNTWSGSIASGMGIPLERAEAMKIAAGEGDISSGIANHLSMTKITDQLVSELKVTIDFFFQSGEAPLDISQLNAVFLSGGGARTPGLESAIAQVMKTPVSIINPFQKTHIPKKFSQDLLASQAGLFNIAVGLSLREQNDHL